jgi:Family of unknown function (DUF6491)
MVALLAACAQQPVRQSSTPGSRSGIDYGKYVQSTVPWFEFNSVYNWDSNQPGYVVVWTSPNEAYRLVLASPCLALQNTFTIFLTSHSGLVTANRDYVVANDDHCAIIRIERLNAKAIRAARKAKASDGKGG